MSSDWSRPLATPGRRGALDRAAQTVPAATTPLASCGREVHTPVSPHTEVERAAAADALCRSQRSTAVQRGASLVEYALLLVLVTLATEA